MNKLPYIQPAKDIDYNIGIVLIILNNLSRTKRGKLNLNFERLQIFYFLATRPVFLNQVLVMADKNEHMLDEMDFFSVDTISQNVDELFDRKKTRLLLKELVLKEYVDVTLSEKDGFLFELNTLGKSIADKLDSGYFIKIVNFTKSLQLLLSVSTSKLNSYINNNIIQR
ncbi:MULTISPECIES: ABC-three component system middle component 4 [Vibrio]|uniref:ABC-three component system middle component 4 n=1 Tax=Vibrio TaxID=662 RepID=UPI00036F1397|nr:MULTISPECIES: ABC-three component system middle component 4 [Vibrio]OEE91446.1 hypothetical protein A140_14080 [Vibrio crassostreae 9ZC88]PMG54044.1 hypothetical protein BCU89_16490 [Vibrio splendidus]